MVGALLWIWTCFPRNFIFVCKGLRWLKVYTFLVSNAQNGIFQNVYVAGVLQSDKINRKISNTTLEGVIVFK